MDEKSLVCFLVAGACLCFAVVSYFNSTSVEAILFLIGSAVGVVAGLGIKLVDAIAYRVKSRKKKQPPRNKEKTGGTHNG